MDHPEFEASLEALSARHDFPPAAVAHLRDAITAGAGDAAMFDHPAFCGPGQWLRGGLILTSRPEDTHLTHRIETLCNELAETIRATPDAAWQGVTFEASGAWWPAELGTPVATGAGDTLAYAYFSAAQRLAIKQDDDITIYDTRGAQITGIAQSRRGSTSETVFSTAEGTLSLDELKRVTADRPAPDAPADADNDLLDTIERLARLRAQGVLSEAEFTAKKKELLDRL